MGVNAGGGVMTNMALVTYTPTTQAYRGVVGSGSGDDELRALVLERPAKRDAAFAW